MTTQRAQSLIITSAAVVAGVYAYKRWTQPGSSAPLATFATAWGVVFFLLALGAEIAPGPAGAMALLVMVSDLLANTQGLAGEVQGFLSGKTSYPAAATASSSTVAAGGTASSGGFGGGAGSTVGAAEAAAGKLAPTPQKAAAAAAAAQANAAGLSHQVGHSPGTPSLAAAAAAEGLHYDPATGQYEPIA